MSHLPPPLTPIGVEHLNHPVVKLHPLRRLDARHDDDRRHRSGRRCREPAPLAEKAGDEQVGRKLGA